MICRKSPKKQEQLRRKLKKRWILSLFFLKLFICNPSFLHTDRRWEIATIFPQDLWNWYDSSVWLQGWVQSWEGLLSAVVTDVSTSWAGLHRTTLTWMIRWHNHMLTTGSNHLLYNLNMFVFLVISWILDVYVL